METRQGILLQHNMLYNINLHPTAGSTLDLGYEPLDQELAKHYQCLQVQKRFELPKPAIQDPQSEKN